MKISFYFLPFCLFIFSISEVVGQKEVLTINLGLYEPGSVTSIQENQKFSSVKLENRIPSAIYDIEISKVKELSPVLTFDPSQGASAAPTEAACAELKQAFMDVSNYLDGNAGVALKDLDETELMKLVEKLKAKDESSECSDELENSVDSILKATTYTLTKDIKIDSGEKVTIKITRDDKVWTFIYKGEEKGKWVATYGFGFTSSAFENSTYYSKQVPDTTTFEILKATDPEALDLNYIPAVFYSYFPSQRFNKNWNHSLTAGLGFDLVAPVVFFGYSALYHHNIGISAGVAFQQQHRLKDQYSENEIIPISLDKDQLHDQVYRPNVFIAINFRFGESPFKSTNEAPEEDQ